MGDILIETVPLAITSVQSVVKGRVPSNRTGTVVNGSTEEPKARTDRSGHKGYRRPTHVRGKSIQIYKTVQCPFRVLDSFVPLKA